MVGRCCGIGVVLLSQLCAISATVSAGKREGRRESRLDREWELGIGLGVADLGPGYLYPFNSSASSLFRNFLPNSRNRF
jgi:hypothetical protein